jgi:hypothetical protein
VTGTAAVLLIDSVATAVADMDPAGLAGLLVLDAQTLALRRSITNEFTLPICIPSRSTTV